MSFLCGYDTELVKFYTWFGDGEKKWWGGRGLWVCWVGWVLSVWLCPLFGVCM